MPIILLQATFLRTVLKLDSAVCAKRNLKFDGVTIEFSRIATRLFNGFETREGYNLALPEKALLDTIHLRKAIPFRVELELDARDIVRLKQFAQLYAAPMCRLAEELGNASGE